MFDFIKKEKITLLISLAAGALSVFMSRGKPLIHILSNSLFTAGVLIVASVIFRYLGRLGMGQSFLFSFGRMRNVIKGTSKDYPETFFDYKRQNPSPKKPVLPLLVIGLTLIALSIILAF